MGYTHYFSFSKPKGTKAADLEKRYQRAILQCARVALFWNAYCEHNGDDASRLSGYSAHCNPGKYGGIQINGKGDNSHEPFQLREHFKENDSHAVKTARKPYDSVIVACLAILKNELGDAIQISSDGKAIDWEYGTKLACSVTRRNIPNPMENRGGKAAA
jgi:hypothetical protein